MTGLPGFLNHDTPLNRALLTVAWHRTDPFGDAFDGLAGDIAELAGLNRAVVVRGLADVADLLDAWVECAGAPAWYAANRGIARSAGDPWDGFREAECAQLAADALSDVERLIEAARPKQVEPPHCEHGNAKAHGYEQGPGPVDGWHCSGPALPVDEPQR